MARYGIIIGRKDGKYLMAIDAYYFSHDSNAKDDPKCVLLIEQLGLEGYGIYWVLIEMLSSEVDHKLKVNEIQGFGITPELISDLIKEYKLFESDGVYFWTNKFKFRSIPDYEYGRLSEININLWNAIRNEVFKRDNYTCYYCGQVGGILEADHIQALSKGGSNELTNLATSCRRCNRQKKDKTVEQFKAWRSEHVGS